MRVKQTQEQQTPWYRIGMVWLMLALPFTAVVASLVTVKIAHQNAPSIIQVGVKSLDSKSP